VNDLAKLCRIGMVATVVMLLWSLTLHSCERRTCLRWHGPEVCK